MSVKLKGTDLGICCCFGILPKKIFNAPKNGIWNIHYSRLPEGKGMNPVLYSLAFFHRKTAVSIFKIDAGIDTGNILSQKEVNINILNWFIPFLLYKKLNKVASQLVIDLLNGKISTIQKKRKSTYFNKQQTNYVLFLYMFEYFSVVSGTYYLFNLTKNFVKKEERKTNYS